ncbi:MAG: alpha/beta fold hydrolase [Gammaproteobacteria bacterium]
MRRLYCSVTALLIVYLALGSTPVAAGDASHTARTAAINGIELYYEIHGSGEPLLLLHGGFGHTGSWHAQLPVLAAHFQVIAIDSRGHGRSSLGREPLSYALMADDVLALLDTLGIERAHLLGWSDGGNIGLEIAIRAPQRLGHLVAFGANYHPEGLRDDAADNARFQAYIARAREEYAERSPHPERWEEFAANISKMWAEQPNYSETELGAIRSPVLVLAGAEEEAIEISHVEAMARLIAEATLSIMPGTGHFALWEQPEAFNRIVLEFLTGAPST